ncbi:hypothetical protein [Nonomuraea gerenzanensis]|uniref:Uncharacterized protein n=1 Tax=Nonomuraea gerenzanensis TaxID=93944 RepID=A0A1M4EIC4_9ACTN|nr:hypothetical protein [Nonomuraea gerenzanensis]UBU10281.1 hypothetical protein LCN96_38860 [Nonomuraea gerenzanensis]SBO98665.1 hypothetical protein BN4615_P8181 [Nonomuraea gerenzanensis]
MIDIPPRTATDAYFAGTGGSRRLDLAFDLDLGELVDGHHVVARGLELSAGGGVLHYEFVPGVRPHETETKGPFFWYWMLSAEDDLGTPYGDGNGGAFDTDGEEAAHGARDLGGVVPGAARRLRVSFRPPEGWTPAGTWCRQVEITLPDGPVTQVWSDPAAG